MSRSRIPRAGDRLDRARGSRETRPPIASRRAASARPHWSTAALSVVGDSRLTSASIVSSNHGRSSRQKSRRLIIVGMILSEDTKADLPSLLCPLFPLCPLCTGCLCAAAGAATVSRRAAAASTRAPGTRAATDGDSHRHEPRRQHPQPRRAKRCWACRFIRARSSSRRTTPDADSATTFSVQPASFVDLVAYYRTVLKDKGRARVRRAGNPRVRRRQVQREHDGVPARA